MASLNGHSVFAAVVVVLIIIAILLIALVYRNRNRELVNNSILTNEPCTAAPTTPINLSAANPQGDLIVLEWTPTSNTSEYVAQISSIPNFTDPDVLFSREVISNAAGFANLTLGVIYYFRVKSVNTCGESPWSTQISLRLEFNYPDTFRIINQNSPQYNVCDNHNDLVIAAQSDRVRYSVFCSDVNGNYFYEPSDQSIRQSSRPNLCLTRASGNTVFNNLCVGSNTQKWVYDGIDRSLCSLNDPQNGCLLTDGNLTMGSVEYAIHGPKNSDPISKWNFLKN